MKLPYFQTIRKYHANVRYTRSEVDLLKLLTRSIGVKPVEKITKLSLHGATSAWLQFAQKLKDRYCKFANKSRIAITAQQVGQLIKPLVRMKNELINLPVFQFWSAKTILMHASGSGMEKTDVPELLERWKMIFQYASLLSLNDVEL